MCRSPPAGCAAVLTSIALSFCRPGMKKRFRFKRLVSESAYNAIPIQGIDIQVEYWREV
jgi:hypothetical protein